MSKEQAKKPVKPKKRVARSGPAATGGAGGVGQDADKKRDTGSVGKGAMEAEPAVEMPAARAPRVTKPGDAEEVEADKAAARVAHDQQTGPMEEAAPAAARKVDTEAPPEVEQVPVAKAAKAPGEKQPEGKAAEEEPVAKAGKAPDEKKPEGKAGEKPVAKAGKGPDEKKPEAKTPAKDDKKPVAKAGKGPDEKKPEAKTPAKDDKKPVAKAGKGPDEKKPDAKTPAKDDKKPVAKAEQGPDEKQPDAKTPAKDDKKPVARAAVGEQTPDAAPASVTKAIDSPGQGRPLEPSTRSAIERRMPVDLRGVRVHDDSAAKEAAGAIDARAFTHGKDIWLGHGESDRDVGLMAHEAAHVAQQSDGSASRVSPKAKKPPAPPKIDEWPSPTEDPVPDAPGYIAPKQAGGTLRLKVLSIPAFKKDFTPANVNMAHRERTGAHIAEWESSVSPKLKGVKPVPIAGFPKDTYFLRPSKATPGKDSGTYVIGTKDVVEARGKRPSWTKKGAPHLFDVDHMWEHQLGGGDKGNLWLLDAGLNRSSGSAINNEINQRIGDVLKAAPAHLKKKPTVDGVRANYKQITADSLDPNLSVKGPADINYTQKNIDDGESLGKAALTPLTADQAAELTGSPTRISVFDRQAGGHQRFIDIKGKKGSWPGGKMRDTVVVTGVTYDSKAKTGSVRVQLFKNLKGVRSESIEGDLAIEPIPGVEYGGWVSPWGIRDRLTNIKLPPLSTISIADLDLDFEQGIVASGSLVPSVPLLSQLGIELKVDGDGIRLAKVFSGSELKLPGPVKVGASNLEVSFGTAGFMLKGHVPFEIEGLGQGSIDAKGTAGGDSPSFELEGTLEVEKELFDEAKVTVRYKDGKFSGDGVLKIGPKKIKGIKSASITASIAEDLIKADGQVEVDIPGVKGGAVSLEYGKETGLKVSGTLALSDGIPGLKGGSITVTLIKKGEGDYKVSGAITATAGIPGVTATITGAYEDGAFEIGGTVDYAKGMLTGQVTVGATNRPVGADGVPAGDPGETVVAYGKGTVTMKLAPWLQGTVGLQIKPDGQLVVSGEVALPSALDLFEEKKVTKRIFSIGLDIPIVGFSVMGQRVGIFATIGGGLDAEAAIGPGQLRDTKLSVTYNPDDEAATKVTGGAQLYIPAHAGLRLFIKGGVGAGIPIVSATVGLEVGAALGLEAALESALQVDWTPSKGLELNASLAAHVEPKFKFDLTAFAQVTVDYLFGTSTLYDERWQLAAFEYGSNLRFGIKFPFHYLEGQPFDVKLSDVEFEYPQIDPGAMLKGLVASIV